MEAREAFLQALRMGDVAAAGRELDAQPSWVELDIPRGTDPWDAGGWRPLHLAAWKGHVGVLELLLERGADIEVLDDGKRSPLHHAIEAGGDAAVQVLLDRAEQRLDALARDAGQRGDPGPDR